MGRGRVCPVPTGATTKSMRFPVCSNAPAAVPGTSGLQVSRFGFLSCRPLPSWPFLPFPAKAGAHYPGQCVSTPWNEALTSRRQRRMLTTAAQKADAGLVLLPAAGSFPALESTHHPTLTSHLPWGGQRSPFLRLMPPPPPAP